MRELIYITVITVASWVFIGFTYFIGFEYAVCLGMAAILVNVLKKK
jgi:hypothetical protein